VGTVLLLPAREPEHAAARSELARRIPAAVAVEAAAGPESAWSARVCAAIPRKGLVPPLRVVCFGVEAALLPAVALALRSRHVPVAEYVLVDADAPSVSDVWPDAPVLVITDRPDPIRALRGWYTAPLAELATWPGDV
jgi:hypothetical protein